MVRKATVEDAERMAEIHTFGWRNAFRGIMADKFLFGELCVSRRAEGFRKAVAEGTDELHVVERDGVVVGFISILDPRDSDKCKADALELRAIYVDPAFMRSGVGVELLVFFEQAALCRSRKEAIIWVLEDNHIGRPFYEKHGYIHDGARKVVPHLPSASDKPVVAVRYAKTIG